MKFSNVRLPAAREKLLIGSYAKGKGPKNRKEFACITGQPPLIFINMKEREGSFIPNGKSDALLGARVVDVGARRLGTQGHASAP